MLGAVRTTIVAAVAAVLIALGGAPAAAFAACPEPVPHPGDDAPKPAIAQWMAAGAGRAAIPAELPVMGALVESGLRNLRTGGADAVGYFAMRTGLWNSGPYAGFPDHPHLQLQWFLDLATRVRQAQIAAGVPDPAVDESAGAAGSPMSCAPPSSTAVATRAVWPRRGP
jgi:hypothetical protein